jgi:hypothetical protein
MRLKNRFSAAALAFVLGGAAMMAPSAAQASRNDRKNVALALGVTSLALLATQRDKTPGIIAGLGAAVAYSSYANDRDCDRDRYRYDYNRYDYTYVQPRVNYYVRDRYDRNDRYDRYDRDGRHHDDWDRHDRDNRYRRDRDNRHDDHHDDHDGHHRR